MRRVFLAFLVLVALAPAAHAQPWLCTDPEGVRSFSYDPASASRKECVHQPIASPNVWRATPGWRAERDAASFPRVDAKTQEKRDLARRELLERELAEERRSLASAMKELQAQKDLRAQAKGGARTDTNLKVYEDRVRTHLSNITNLEKELGREG